MDKYVIGLNVSEKEFITFDVNGNTILHGADMESLKDYVEHATEEGAKVGFTEAFQLYKLVPVVY